MSRSLAILGTSVLLAIIAAFTILLGLGRDVEQLSDIVVTAIIPTVVAFYGANKASQAAHNTNGRMTELIALIRENMPDAYEQMSPELKEQERMKTDKMSASEFRKRLRDKSKG